MVKAPERSERTRKKPCPAFMFANSISAPAMGASVSPSTTRPVMRLTSPCTGAGRSAMRPNERRIAIDSSRRVIGILHMGRRGRPGRRGRRGRRLGKHDDGESIERSTFSGASEHADAAGLLERPRYGARLARKKRDAPAGGADEEPFAARV